ncbi:phosphonate C-P lyase system protein PhnH [Phreatobacter stygius]|uniref:Phosphonate C-P lyase system protein PhnH n=1 Tax=Phreatobacter stygius TaxID=1940610 RepID=A0A4D7B7P2_9HYPH|nr:phosphonate C-P lyase system protein PhnH [Phreatobacter stygius]QCI63927.1 phosphonate C-P lyase system protein PhnH [Phreatobacter stygius]
MAIALAYADPVHEAQQAFRAVMNALARPGTVQPVAGLAEAPAPLDPVAAAVLLALADFETSVFLDRPASTDDVRTYLTFHSGARLAQDPAQAAFAVIADPLALADLSSFALGTDAYPDRSTTLILQVPSLTEGRSFRLEGPGIKGSAKLTVTGLPADITARLAANHALFPRGVDLVLAAPTGVAALPRTTRISEA